MIVVDDHFIARRLAAGGLGWPTSAGSEPGVATTCSWWWRLSSALAGSRGGTLSGHFRGLQPRERSALLGTVATLPRRLVILDIRQLIPAMAALSAEHGLNQLSAEALVAADVLGAELVVGQDTPKIRQGAVGLGIGYRIEA